MPCHAKIFMTQDEALHKAFLAPSKIERKTLYLSDEQVVQIQALSQTKVDSHIYTYYVGQSSSGVSGYAFFDTQIVRTMPATYMVVITAAGDVSHVDILAFHEPDDYLPRAAWLKLYEGKKLDDRIRLRRGIPNVTGASLTCQAINEGVRRLLAVYDVAVEQKLERVH